MLRLEKKKVCGVAAWVVASLVLGVASFVVVRVAIQSSSATAARASSPSADQVLESEGTPYTSVLLEKRYDQEGNEVWREYITYAVRSDGSSVERRYRQLPDSQSSESRGITDLQRGVYVAVNSATQSTITRPLGRHGVEFYRSQATNCLSQGGAPTGEIRYMLGYEAYQVREEKTSGGETIRYDQWMAPALVGCGPLGSEASRGPAGGPLSWRGQLREAVSVIEGEPAESLFAIPTSYTERSPSEVFAEYERRFPTARRPVSRATADMLDRVYRSHQKNR